jgi:hypothetical protein
MSATVPSVEPTKNASSEPDCRMFEVVGRMRRQQVEQQAVRALAVHLVVDDLAAGDRGFHELQHFEPVEIQWSWVDILRERSSRHLGERHQDDDPGG